MAPNSVAADNLQFRWGGSEFPTACEAFPLPAEIEPLSEDAMGPWGMNHFSFSLTPYRRFAQPLNSRTLLQNMWEAQRVCSRRMLEIGMIVLT